MPSIFVSSSLVTIRPLLLGLLIYYYKEVCPMLGLEYDNIGNALTENVIEVPSMQPLI